VAPFTRELERQHAWATSASEAYFFEPTTRGIIFSFMDIYGETPPRLGHLSSASEVAGGLTYLTILEMADHCMPFLK
jgi:hypothetical protein